MLEKYFVKPQTVDRVRGCWIGAEIERYVEWLCGREYAARTVWQRVPILVGFGEFARAHGAKALEDLPIHVDAFVAQWAAKQQRRHPRGDRDQVGREVRGPIEQLLELVVAGFSGSGRPRRRAPFSDAAPGFFEYLAAERGLRPASILAYRFGLDRFEDYLTGIGVKELAEVSPTVLAAFVAERRAAGLAKTTVRQTCGVLRVFLRYAYREGVCGRDLSDTVAWPQVYRLSDIPRAITWAEVEQVLVGVDRRTGCGKRDYAIMLLLVSYGLRGREIAALTLDDIDWKRERLAIPERKAGHSTAFPLSAVVGEALVDYLRHGRPDSSNRHVFFRAVAPVEPIRVAPAETRFLERDEIEDLLHHLPSKGRLALRDRTLLLFLYNTGARAQEVADLQVGHLDLCEHPLVRLHGKGDKWRTCPLWHQTAKLIRALLDSVVPPPTPQTPVFCAHGQALTRFGIYKIVRRHTSDLDNPQIHRRVSPHTFRHSCAVHLLEAGVEINVIRGWLGHADLSTTNRYAEINTKTKLAALRTCEPPTSSEGHRSTPIWRSDQTLLNWLASL